MSKNTPLVPNYVDADFSTIKNRLVELLSKTDTFKDYDFEGANITILMELIAYLGDLNAFYTNKLAKNIHPETADIYEVVHSLVRQQGHEPRGYISAKVDLDITVSINLFDDDGVLTDSISNYGVIEQGDQLTIPKWFKIDTGLTDSVTGEAIYYTFTDNIVYTLTSSDVTNGSISIPVTLRQGKTVEEPLIYTGQDLIDNRIILPFKTWDYGNFPYSGQSNNPVELFVGEIEKPWVRLDDFYDDLSGLYDLEEVFMLVYDKYKQYSIQFSETRLVPSIDERIKLILLNSLGLRGSIGKNTIVDTPITDTIFGVGGQPFMSNLTKDYVIPTQFITISQPNSSYGASSPQTIDEIKESGRVKAASQKRNVTVHDYVGYIADRSDVVKANVWGEKEKNPSSIFVYNKVYISVIPSYWNAQTITLGSVDVTGEFTDEDPNIVNEPDYVPLVKNVLSYPVDFDEDWGADISEYLEPRKMINIYEEYVVPEFVYFRFDFGLRVKRSYDFSAVRNAIKNKLLYYFRNSARSFGEEIDFRDIYNYVVDVTITSENDEFSGIQGINTLVIRDVLSYTPSLVGSANGPMHIFDQQNPQPYSEFPHYINESYSSDIENTLKSIKLGFNQFPQLAIEQCKFINEGR